MIKNRFLIVLFIIPLIIPFFFIIIPILLVILIITLLIIFYTRFIGQRNDSPQLLRDIFLIRFKSPLFPSHWMLFVPDKTGHFTNWKNTGPGKVIHVEGDVNGGFELVFKRNYDPLKTRKGMEVEFLASIDNAFVVNPTSPTFRSDDKNALSGDLLEQIALSVEAPYKTLGVKDAKGKAVQLCDCQWWVKEYAKALVAARVIPAEVLSTLDRLPTNL